MAQIVIELSDETYKDIKEENSIYGINSGLSVRTTGKVIGAIQNGKPLPKGHWIMHQDHRECSNCGVYFLKNMPRNSYCPNCGAKMLRGLRLIDADALIERLIIDSPDPEGVSDWIDIINDEYKIESEEQ